MKMSILKLLAVPALVCCFANSAFAIFDADAMIGKSWYSLKGNGQTQGISATKLSVAAHVDPIPLVPVSFGLRLDYEMLKHGDTGLDSVDTATVVRPGIDITAWVPMVPIVTPYVRLEVPLAAKMVVKGKSGGTSVDDEGDITGYDLAIGVKYSVIPLVKVMAEVGRSTEKFKQTTLTVSDFPTPPNKSTFDMNGTSFLVGVEVGI